MLYLSSVLEEDTTYAFVPEHDFLGFVYCLHGKVPYTVNNVTGMLQKGYFNMAYLPAGSCNVVLPAGRYASFCMEVDADYLKLLLPGVPILQEFLPKVGGADPAWICQNHPLIAPRILHSIYSVIGNGFEGELQSLYLDCKFVDLIIASLHHCQYFKIGLDEGDVRKIKETKEYIEQNLKFRLDVSYLADKISLTRKKFEAGFKQLFGTSVFDFITNERMQQARVMLRDSTLTISEISLSLGYTRLNNFYKTFKRRFGYSPGELRKNDGE
jgi:AraC-like DNA-binding protein